MKKLLSSIVAIVMIVGLGVSPVFAKTKSPVTVKCNDTIAGYDTDIEINTLKNTEINLMLSTPSGGKVYLQEKSNDAGSLATSVADYHLQRSGDYTISAKFAEQNEDFGNKCSFTVYPGDLSVNKSLLTVNRKTAEAGIFENIIAEVKLVDNFGNPIKGHSIELLSSRSEDDIQLLSQLPYTDDNGAIAFLVNSEKSGMSTLSAIDTSDNITLDARTKIAFIAPDDIKAIGGSDLSYDNYFEDASIFLSSITDIGEVYELIIELKDENGDNDMNGEIKKNLSASISVSAVDELGNVVPNYTGTIRFSATDENASLPEDYTFTNEDLGVHDFALGVTFKIEGTQILSVNDIDSFAVKGEVEFEITPTELLPVVGVSKEVNLTSPSTGSYNSNEVKISGSAAPNTKLQITDNDLVLQEITSDNDGGFDITLQNVEDGDHLFFVTSVDATDKMIGRSSKVTVTIDTVAPMIEAFEIDQKDAVQIDSDINAKLNSEANLGSASLIVEDRIIKLTENIDMPGEYTGMFKAPSKGGEYEIDLVLKDNIGNEGNFPKHIILQVVEDEILIPSQVVEIDTVGSDQRVTLTWASAEDDTYITNYKISYGPDPEDLTFEATTFDSSTTWYIPYLANGEPNYFGIQAIDSDGNPGPISDLIVAQAIEPAPELGASLEDPVVLEELPARTPETGPEIWFILLSSLLLVDIFYRRRKNA
ncbi:MAG: hypothetical protein Q8P68_05335 [Candidatus Peregrinibacteria bacterium]|nr:hypothetical protein [Candidatus Peregrinibacteria bacterium]MDZ4244384.1 hypothetical protein [Candidatus Gracilibacteria bacterium]